ncbi:MAG: class I SAM-dependent methyltransferase [Burkholderiales bacterium]|nr:class I SAM-dependent methyltransferase [Burkholderiales bacterium]
MSILLRLLQDILSAPKKGRQPEPADKLPSIADIRAMADAGNIEGAIGLCERLCADEPGSPDARDLLLNLGHAATLREIRQHFPGPDYFSWLQWFHATLAPRTYLEIGVASGQSLQHAGPQTKAAGVDPAFTISHPPQAWVRLFRETSDDFFAKHNMQEVFGEDTVDLVFLDGLHTFDQTLRDLVNVERHCHSRSVVLLHDILPVIPETAERERRSLFWVGDTWKVLVLLARHRPDLDFFTLPTFPSGLAAVTKLNAASPHATALRADLDSLCAAAMSLELADFLPDMFLHQRVIANNHEDVRSRLLPG